MCEHCAATLASVMDELNGGIQRMLVQHEFRCPVARKERAEAASRLRRAKELMRL